MKQMAKAKSDPRCDEKTILGIDPGSQFTGFGVVIAGDEQIKFLSFGVIAPPRGLRFSERIALIAGEFDRLLERVRPDITVIERVFLGKNADSAFKLGHARGITVAASIRSGSQVVEYATRAVKKGVTGSGAASKEQVQTVLGVLLGIRHEVRFDASDALALAYHHARCLQTEVRLDRGRTRQPRDEEELK